MVNGNSEIRSRWVCTRESEMERKQEWETRGRKQERKSNTPYVTFRLLYREYVHLAIFGWVEMIRDKSGGTICNVRVRWWTLTIIYSMEKSFKDIVKGNWGKQGTEGVHLFGGKEIQGLFGLSVMH